MRKLGWGDDPRRHSSLSRGLMASAVKLRNVASALKREMQCADQIAELNSAELPKLSDIRFNREGHRH